MKSEIFFFFRRFVSLPPLTNVKSLSASSLHDELRAQHLSTFLSQMRKILVLS